VEIAVVTYFKKMTLLFTGGTDENLGTLRRADIGAEVRTGHLLIQLRTVTA
jgi:hypothetical protein